MFICRVSSAGKIISNNPSLFSIQCAPITSRTHVKDYRPRPTYPIPRRPFLPPRKREALLTHPTPTIDPFETSFQPIRNFEEIEEFYPNDQNQTTNADADDEDDDEFANIHRKIWPYKKWLWRTDKNLENRAFDPKKQLEYFQDDENISVGRAWYITELRLKSNEDLWRLWYVLLREKNMLQTMRFQCRAHKRQMPNWGRLIKIRKSMVRVKEVWNERAKLKLLNLETEQKKKQEEMKNTAIEYRRAKMLENRENIKGLFFEYVNRLEDNGENVEHLFPQNSYKPRRARTKKHVVIDEAMALKPVLTSSDQTRYIPGDLLQIIENAGR